MLEVLNFLINPFFIAYSLGHTILKNSALLHSKESFCFLTEV